MNLDLRYALILYIAYICFKISDKKETNCAITVSIKLLIHSQVSKQIWWEKSFVLK